MPVGQLKVVVVAVAVDVVAVVLVTVMVVTVVVVVVVTGHDAIFTAAVATVVLSPSTPM
jgi:hypothetical protein